MALISVTLLNSILDNCNGYYLDILGTNSGGAAAGYGYGDSTATWGASVKAANISTAIAGSGDLSIQSYLSGPAIQLQTTAQGLIAAGQDLSQILFQVQRNIIQYSPNATVRNLDTYLTYLNTQVGGSYWQALQYPTWSALGAAWFAGATPSPWNIYSLAASTNATALASKVVGGAYTSGVTIDGTKYAGGFPTINCVSITGAGGVVTVTGTARAPGTYTAYAGTYTWTATIATGTNSYTLTPGGGNPAPANSLILAVSAISVGSGPTGGTIYALASAPTGRPSEP